MSEIKKISFDVKLVPAILYSGLFFIKTEGGLYISKRPKDPGI